MSKRNSIRATYDSRETGLPYWVSTWVGARTVEFQNRVPDPFVRHTVTVGWPDLLRGLLRGQLKVTVRISAEPDVMEDVMELDENYLGPNCTRRDAFHSHINEAIARTTGA